MGTFAERRGHGYTQPCDRRANTLGLSKQLRRKHRAGASFARSLDGLLSLRSPSRFILSEKKGTSSPCRGDADTGIAGKRRGKSVDYSSFASPGNCGQQNGRSCLYLRVLIRARTAFCKINTSFMEPLSY